MYISRSKFGQELSNPKVPGLGSRTQNSIQIRSKFDQGFEDPNSIEFRSNFDQSSTKFRSKFDQNSVEIRSQIDEKAALRTWIPDFNLKRSTENNPLVFGSFQTGNNWGAVFSSLLNVVSSGCPNWSWAIASGCTAGVLSQSSKAGVSNSGLAMM